MAKQTDAELIKELRDFGHKKAAKRLGELLVEVDNLQDEVDEARQSGYSDGYDDGYRSGYDDGYEQGMDDGRD